MKLTTQSRLLWLSTVAVSLGAACLAPPALAAQPAGDVYVGGNAAFSRAPGLAGAVDGALANQGITSTSSADKPDATFGLRLGYRLNPTFAVEASYDRIGNTALQSAIAAPAADTAAGTWKARGFGLHVVGTVPIDPKWSLYGRVGVERWHTALDTASSSGGATAASASGDNTSLALGAGAAYAITPQLDATAELVRYNRVGVAGSTGAVAVNQVNVGLRYNFR